MEDKKTTPEAAVKFFVGLSSAGIALIAALAERLIAALAGHSFTFTHQSSHSAALATAFGFVGTVCTMISLALFVGCIIEAVGFYSDATTGSILADEQAEQKLRSHVSRCAKLCLIGVVLLAIAAFLGLAVVNSLLNLTP